MGALMRDTRFSDSALEALRQLIGAEYQFIAGPQNAVVLASQEIVISTSVVAVFFASDAEEFDVGDDWDFFAHITPAKATNAQIAQACSTGDIFRQFAGQVIQDVIVITDSIRCERKGGDSWSHVTDSGVVLVLQRGFVLLVLHSLHAEVMFVSFGTEFDLSQVPIFSSIYGDHEDQTCFRSRSAMSLAGRPIADTAA